MLKRITSVVLALALVLGVCASAWAVAPNDGELFMQTQDSYQYAAEVAGEGSTIYILINSPNDGTIFNLYRYTLGDQDPTLLAENLFYTRNFGVLEDTQYTEGFDMSQALGLLFIKDGALYSFNTLTGDFARVETDGAKVNLVKETTFDISFLMANQGEYSYMMNIDSMAYTGDKLYFATADYSKEQPVYALTALNMQDGSVTKISDKRMTSLTPYKDGKFLCEIPAEWDDAAQKTIQAQLGELDMETGALVSLGELEESPARGFQYKASNDTLYYSTQDCIMAMPGLGTPQRIAYVSSYATDRTLLLDTHFVCWGNDAVYIRNLDPQYLPTKTLSVVGSYRGFEGNTDFTARYPDIPLLFANISNDATSLGQAMVAGEDSIDVIESRVDDGFDMLLKKGYCADITSSEKLMSFVQSLYPNIQKELMVDGKLYAIPVSVYAYNFTFSPDNMAAVGLTQDDVPTNFIELCQFITRWNNELVDQYPDSIPFHSANMRNYLFEQMRSEYVAYYDAMGLSLDFDTPLFHSLLTALDEMQSDNLDLPEKPTDADFDELYKKTALFDGGMNALSESRGNYTREPMLLSLDSQTPYVLPAEMTVAFVNPRTANMAEAITLLECYVDNLDERAVIFMSPGANEPIVNNYYDETVKSWEDHLKYLNETVATAPAEQKKDFETEIEYFVKLLENKEDYRYDLSSKTIQAYRETQGESLAVKHKNILIQNAEASEQLRTLHKRYQTKQMTRDQYIKDLNQKTQMMVMENR